MKKTIYAIAALALVTIGCAKKEFNETFAPGDVVTVRAQVNDTYTKVAADNAGKFSWQDGDKITILNADNDPFEFATVKGGTDAAFTSTSFSGELGSIAYYPASDSHTQTVFNLASEFAWVENASNMPMIGTVNTSEKKVSFKTAGAAIKLVCFNVPADARKLVVSSDSKKLSGEFTPTGTPAAIVTADKGAYDNTITVTFGDGHPTNMVFYVPVPTGDLGKLTFVMKNGSDAEVSPAQTTKQAIPMARQHIVAAPALNCDGGTILWSEDFDGFSSGSQGGGLSYSIDNGTGGGTTKTYNETNAGGTSPELLIAKTNGYFQASGIPTDGNSTLSLSFKENYNRVAVSSATTGVTITEGSFDSEAKLYTCTVNNSQNKSTIELTFTNTSGSNVRVDDFILFIPGKTFTAPTLTVSKEELFIDKTGGSDNTTFTLSNPFDATPVAAVVEAGATWLTTSIAGNTLTVTASENTGAPRSATVTLRATGVSKQITVNQGGNTIVNTYVFSNKSWGATLNGDPADWTTGKDGNGYTAGQGVQVTTGVTGAKATSPVSFTNVSEIVVTYNTNKSAGAGTIKVKVGSNAEKSNAVAYSGSADGRSADFTTTFTFSPNQSGTVLLTTDVTTNSLWIKSIKITAASAE